MGMTRAQLLERMDKQTTVNEDGSVAMDEVTYVELQRLAERPSYHKDSADVRRFTTQVMTAVLPRTAAAIKSEVQRAPKSAFDKKGNPQIDWEQVSRKFANVLAASDDEISSLIIGS